MATNDVDDWVDLPIEKDAGADDWEDVPLEPGVGQQALNVVGAVGKGVDAWGGDASTRAAIYAAQTGKPVIQAFTDQYGSSKGAPTGKQIAMEGGVEDEPFPDAVQSVGRAIKNYTPMGIAYQALAPQDLQDRIESSTKADVAGVGVEMAASPLNALPMGKPIITGLSHGAHYMGNALKTGARTVGLDKGLYAVGRGAAKVAEGITGAPYDDIVTYTTKGPEVNQAIEASGRSSAQLADNVREGYQKSLGETRGRLNSEISAAEKAASPKKLVPIQTVIDSLQAEKGKLHKTLDLSEIEQINEIVEALNQTANKRKLIGADELVRMTKSLQSKAKGSYGISPSGKQLGNQVQKAANSAAEESRTLRNTHLPDVEEPFKKLQRINEVADEANPNLFIPGKPDPAFYAAGAGKNERGLKHLKEMEEATGAPFVEPAKIASSARTFMNPSLTPTDTTGKSVYRALLGAGVFGQGLGLLGAPVELASKLGAAASSPAALKLGIDTVRKVGKIPGAIDKGAKSISQKQFMEAFLALKAARAKELESRKKR